MGGWVVIILLLARYVAAARFLIIRHGQTDHNAQGIIQGSSDQSRLTPKGIAQAREAGATLAQLDDVRCTRLYVSPLTRAAQTLDVLQEEAVRAGAPLSPAVVVEDLREIDLHSWEGCTKTELQVDDPCNYRAWKCDPGAMVVDGHRPISDLWARAAHSVWPLVRLASKSDPPDGMTFLVCHGSLGQALLCTAFGLSESAWRKHSFPNLGAVELEWPADAPQARRWRWRLPLEAAAQGWQSQC
mgnify:CR=1 FL=1